GVAVAQELPERNSVPAHEQLPGGAVRLLEGSHPGQAVAAAAALYLDRGELLAAVEDEVDLLAAVTPVEELGAGVAAGRQVAADGGPAQPTPVLRVAACLLEGAARDCGDERRVQRQQLRRRAALADLRGRVFLQSDGEPGRGEEVQVARKGGRVAGVLEL